MANDAPLSGAEKTRRWRKRHPEYYRSATIRRINNAYKQRNREKVRAAGLRYCREHKEESKEYYQMNKEAIKARVNAYRQANLEKSRAQAKMRWHAKWDKLFGWDKGTHQRLWNEAVSCSLCGVPFEEETNRKHTDHDHRTGKFRGIIHHACNQILGLVKDSEAHALQVATYLRIHQ